MNENPDGNASKTPPKKFCNSHGIVFYGPSNYSQSCGSCGYETRYMTVRGPGFDIHFTFYPEFFGPTSYKTALEEAEDNLARLRESKEKI